ncbi:MAG: bifunctional oligoribonuclease/PAP phosphatase NrnA [Bacteroidetes bacterium]|uniref:Bifunctional oligoribonuclease/PAP phosphatase NrnA n=1 Tax=Candidatus Cryptobacteroides avicola TaxID=2840757 RepID=A0A940IHN0_9BACT|nr:bifunctional oligoribonuclease/PAP phosphatase NrnA [Candidatus Cryptobacteroides avicola]
MDIISQSDISKLERFIEDAQKIAITAHMRPDGDAVGSCAALFHCLGDMGKDAVIVLPDASPDYLGFITEAVGSRHLTDFESDGQGARDALAGCDLIFCLDYNAFHRTGKMEQALSGHHAVKILVDHHLNPARECFDLVFSETEVSSTAEYLYNILLMTSRYGHDAGKLPEQAATALMTGMTTDTNNFANSVFPSTLRMASSLLEAGVDRDFIISRLYNEYSEGRIRLMGELLSKRLEITPDGVAYMILDRKTIEKYGLKEGDTEGFVNIPLGIGRVKISCFFKEDEDRIRVSLRSKRGISANRCAALYFNGGGHEQAAGGRLAVPEDIGSIGEVAAYAEKVMHEFMVRQAE